MNLKVLFEDNHIIVVEKPQGILSQGDSTKDRDMLTLIKEYLKEKYNKPGNVFLGLVHRLDQPVGGVMVFAKTSKAASRLSQQIREHKFKKIYLAVSELTDDFRVEIGEINELKDYLLKDEKTNTVKVVNNNVEGAKEAVLEYKVLEKEGNFDVAFLLLEVEIKTGRAHQIRVQLANAGLPIFNDKKYNVKAQEDNRKSDICLWAYKLAFEHPTTKEKMEFKLKPPAFEPWNLFKIKL